MIAKRRSPLLMPTDYISIYAPRNLGGTIAKFSPTPDGGSEVVAWNGTAWVPVDIPTGNLFSEGIPASDEVLKRNGIPFDEEKTELKATKYEIRETSQSKREFLKAVRDDLASDREWSDWEASKMTRFIIKSIIAVGVIGTIVTTVYWLHVFYD